MKDLWGIREFSGEKDLGWYSPLGTIALGAEVDAKDKADRLNDKDVEGKHYRAERYS